MKDDFQFLVPDGIGVNELPGSSRSAAKQQQRGGIRFKKQRQIKESPTVQRCSNLSCFEVNQQAQQVVNQSLNTDALLEMLEQVGVADDFISHCFNALRLVPNKGLYHPVVAGHGELMKFDEDLMTLTYVQHQPIERNPGTTFI